MWPPLFAAVEGLPDGRWLLELGDGTILVQGESNREPEAARMGYRGGPAPRRRHAPAPVLRRRVPARHDELDPFARADALFVSLLDADQAAQWRARQACWVATPQGPVRLGVHHDLRWRPTSHPGEEWSLCVVADGRDLPPGDQWTNLLLVLAVEPERFFRVANVRARGLPLSAPHPPPSVVDRVAVSR